MKKALIVILVFLIIASGAYIAIRLTDPGFNDDEKSILSSEPSNESNKVDVEINEVILGEARRQMKLIVLEYEVCAEQVWNDSWGEWGIFKKTKSIKTYGVGTYTVDLSALDAESISIDGEKLTVKITVPDVELDSVTVDFDKTEFEDTERGLLRFGDIKLTAEQSNEVNSACTEAMREKLNESSAMLAAKEAASEQIKNLFDKVLTEIDPDYEVSVSFTGN